MNNIFKSIVAASLVVSFIITSGCSFNRVNPYGRLESKEPFKTFEVTNADNLVACYSETLSNDGLIVRSIPITDGQRVFAFRSIAGPTHDAIVFQNKNSQVKLWVAFDAKKYVNLMEENCNGESK